MLKVFILFSCLSTFVCCYSFLLPKDKQDVELTMGLLQTIEENQLDKDNINELLDASFVSKRVKFDVKTHILLGLNYSKYKRLDDGEYVLQ